MGLVGAIWDLHECSRELPGTRWGALGELSGSSGASLGASSGAVGRLLGALKVIKSSSVAESSRFRGSSSRLHGSIGFEVRRRRKLQQNRSLGSRMTSEEARRGQRASKVVSLATVRRFWCVKGQKPGMRNGPGLAQEWLVTRYGRGRYASQIADFCRLLQISVTTFDTRLWAAD